MLGLSGQDREASDAGARSRQWRVPDDAARARPGAGSLLPDISLNAGKARYVAGDAPLPAGPYSRRPLDEVGLRRGGDSDLDMDSYGLRRGDVGQRATAVPSLAIRAGGAVGGAARRTDWSAKYGNR